MQNRIGIGVGIAVAVPAAATAICIALNLEAAADNPGGMTLPLQLLMWGRVAGIWTALTFLGLLLTMGQGRTVEFFLPKAHLAVLHRWFGFATLPLLLLHAGLILAGKSLVHQETPLEAAWRFFSAFWGSLVGIGVIVLVGILTSCALFLRKKMRFPVWRVTHYFTYLAVLLFFFHQIFYGQDFSVSTFFFRSWIALFLLVWLDVIFWKIRLWKNSRP